MQKAQNIYKFHPQSGEGVATRPGLSCTKEIARGFP